jgi:hypothetical protein
MRYLRGLRIPVILMDAPYRLVQVLMTWPQFGGDASHPGARPDPAQRSPALAR